MIILAFESLQTGDIRCEGEFAIADRERRMDIRRREHDVMPRDQRVPVYRFAERNPGHQQQTRHSGDDRVYNFEAEL